MAGTFEASYTARDVNNAETLVTTVSGATSGRLLVGTIAVRTTVTSWNDFHTYTLIESGDTGAVAYRIADGTSNDNFEVDWTGSNKPKAIVCEYSGLDGTSGVLDAQHSVSTLSNNALTHLTTAATPDEANGMAFTSLAWFDEGEFVNSGMSIDESFTIDGSYQDSAFRACVSAASKTYTTAASTNPEWTAASGSGSASDRDAFLCFFLDAAAGGTTYNRTSADTFTTADADTRTATFARDIAEALSLVDASSRTAAFERAIAESLALVDATTQAKEGIDRESAETLSLTDATTFTQEHGRAVAEALDFADASTRVAVYERLVSDALTVIDATTQEGGEPNVEVSTGGGQSMTLRQMRRLEREQLLAMIREDDDVIIALVTQLLSKGRNLQ